MFYVFKKKLLPMPFWKVYHCHKKNVNLQVLRQLFEIFLKLQIQERIVVATIICGNTVKVRPVWVQNRLIDICHLILK